MTKLALVRKTTFQNEVSVNHKAALEQLQHINQLNEEEEGILLNQIETIVSIKRFKRLPT